MIDLTIAKANPRWETFLEANGGPHDAVLLGRYWEDIEPRWRIFLAGFDCGVETAENRMTAYLQKAKRLRDEVSA